MKSKFFKVILPTFAIMLALGLSSFTVNDDVTTLYYDDPNISGVQSTEEVTCPGGTIPCTVKVGPNFYQLYPTIDLTPGTELKKSE